MVKVTVWIKTYSDLIDLLHLIRRLDESELWQRIINDQLENTEIFKTTFDGKVNEIEIMIKFAHDILPIRDIQIYAHTSDGIYDIEEWVEKVADP